MSVYREMLLAVLCLVLLFLIAFIPFAIYMEAKHP